MYRHIDKLVIPQATSQLNTWLDYIEHLHYKSIDLNLDRIYDVAKKMDLLHPARLVIIVGGTNGKGTTCHLIELTTGMRVGVYSSPHLLRYTERIRIQGQELTDTLLCTALEKIEAGRGKTSLSYFEFSTLAAVQIFQQSELDVAILEVGLGGRLDATNIISADISVITTIALDHTRWLGSDRASIAREKAGIFCRGKLAVVGESDRPTTIDSAVSDSGAILYAHNRDWWWKIQNNKWDWWDTKKALIDLPLPTIPLENAATAIATIQCLPFSVSETAIHTGLRSASLPGRFQCINQSPLIILDVAHNPHASSYLSSRLAALLSTKRGILRAVVGMFADKDIAGTLSYIVYSQVKVLYCVSLDGHRSASAAQLASYLYGNVKQFENLEKAWQQVILDAEPEDCVIIFGSFRIVASILAHVEKRQYPYNK